MPLWHRCEIFSVVLVYFFVCLSVCEKHYSKSYELIGMKFHCVCVGGTGSVEERERVGHMRSRGPRW